MQIEATVLIHGLVLASYFGWLGSPENFVHEDEEEGSDWDMNLDYLVIALTLAFFIPTWEELTPLQGRRRI